MKHVLSITITLVLLASFFGCATAPKGLQTASEGEIPEWYTTPPTAADYLYAANTATSQDMQIAVEKALAGARTEIGRQVELRIQGLQKRFDEEVGVGQDAQLLQQFTQASKTVVSTSISGSRAKEQKIFKDAEIYRAYVLADYPIGAANQAFLEQLKKNEQMYTRFRSSETFKELNEEVEKYEKWKKEQGNR